MPNLRSTPPCHISPHRCNDKGVGPQKLKFLLRFDRNVAYPLREFHKICRVCNSFQDALCVKILLNVLKGLWSYGGFKLRGSGCPQIFSTAKMSLSGHHPTTLSGYIFATKARIDSQKQLLNSNTSSTRPHNMANFGPPTAETGSGVWGTPAANFNGFRVLASRRYLLQRRRSAEANQTLHDVWPSPGLLHSICIFGGSCHLTEFCQVQNARYLQVLRSSVLSRELHLYSAGRPSRWASGHILVIT